MPNTALPNARSCLLSIQQKLGSASPRFRAFTNLLRAYDANNGNRIALARSMKDILRGYDSLEREFESFLPDEVVDCILGSADVIESDDESDAQDGQCHVSCEDDARRDAADRAISIIGGNNIEIEEEYDVDIYGDYDVVEFSDDESEVSFNEMGVVVDEDAASVSEDGGSTEQSDVDNTNTADVLRTGKRGRSRRIYADSNVESKRPRIGQPNAESHVSESRRSKQSKWTEEEDNLLLSRRQEDNQYSIIAEAFPGKTAKQCRERYCSYLDPALNRDKGKRTWTGEEDQLLDILHKEHGNKWAKIAYSIDGKSALDVKNRWYSQKRSQERAQQKTLGSEHKKYKVESQKAAREQRSLERALRQKYDEIEESNVPSVSKVLEHKQDDSTHKVEVLPRGVTQRPSGKWQAQIFYAGKMRYIGVYQTRQAACTAFNTIREYLMRDEAQNAAEAKDIQRFVEEARKIAQCQIEETN